uniref:Trefoil factor 2 n=1 Tax=Vombatus ursinus TaxID=29139 RepID=A0A4X2L0Y0_VOMUR
MEPQSPWFLVILFILGLCNVAGGEKPSACQCSRIEPKNRENCGFPGISSEKCFASGCCFDTQVFGVPWCFTPLPKEDSEECIMEVKARVNCGYPGISSKTCKARECCFDNKIPGVPWCFHPLPYSCHKHRLQSIASSVNCSYPSINSPQGCHPIFCGS